jgi:hypothetical protein
MDTESSPAAIAKRRERKLAKVRAARESKKVQ